MIKENLKTVQEHIKESIAKRHNAASEDVLLVAVTKNHDVASMQEAIDAGANVIGENRVQEALQKHETLNRDVTWHLIGHLQTNKAKYAVKLFDMIESVDSIKLAEALNKEAQKIDKVQQVLVQVNLVKEASKTGVYLEELDELLAKIDILSNLKLMGLMFIAPKVDNLEETGAAVVNGLEWTARTKNTGEILNPGDLAKVIEISGVKLIVEKYQEE